MSSSKYNTIREAIQNRHQVIATYNGKTRELSPHAIGTKDGREQALFYQFGGASSSGPIVPGSPKNWRCLPIEGLSNIETRSGDWHTSDNHSTRQTCIDIIDLEVS